MKKLSIILAVLILALNCKGQDEKRDYYYIGDLLVISGIVLTTTSFFSMEKMKIDGKTNYREQLFYAGLGCIASGITFNVINTRRIKLELGTQMKLTLYINDNRTFKKSPLRRRRAV